MGKALYRTYRSKKLSEIVGQEHITTALSRALEQGAISHAYLFTGPRGTGKTSIARILAHEINGLSYEKEGIHLDIIEIDAASNRRIDEIRDLRDKVHTAPTNAKYKVYIIDEVHMLTREAFNALLKTLEEPPAHVVFMLATTEVHKLPETIISRTQRFGFKPVERGKVVEHLKHIAKQEKIPIAEDALEIIAAHGEGTFRDSISLLDQMRHSGQQITADDVQAALGIAPAELIADIVSALKANEASSISNQLHKLHEQGFEPAHTARQLGQALRESLTSGNPPLPPRDTLQLLAALVEVPARSDPKAYLEIALLDAVFAQQAPAAKHTPAPKPTTPKVMPEDVQAPADVQVEPHPSSFHKAHRDPTPHAEAPQQKDHANAATAPAPKPNTTSEQPTSQAAGAVLTDDSWKLALGTIKQQHNTLYSILNMAAVSFEPGVVVISTSNQFYKKRLEEARNAQIICNTVRDVTGQSIALTCKLSDTPPPKTNPKTPPLPAAEGETVHTVKPAATPPKAPSAAVDTISNIFGGAEVLE